MSSGGPTFASSSPVGCSSWFACGVFSSVMAVDLPRGEVAKRYADPMCRNIRTLHNFEPPATEDEVRAPSLQYVRKISGYNKPSQANAEAFERAVDAVTAASLELLEALTTSAPPKDREAEAAKARARAQQRYAA